MKRGRWSNNPNANIDTLVADSGTVDSLAESASMKLIKLTNVPILTRVSKMVAQHLLEWRKKNSIKASAADPTQEYRAYYSPIFEKLGVPQWKGKSITYKRLIRLAKKSPKVEVLFLNKDIGGCEWQKLGDIFVGRRDEDSLGRPSRARL